MAAIDLHLARLKARPWAWAIPWPAVEMIARKEGCELTAYLCPAGVWTIAWGETEGIQPGMRWTPDQADARLRQQLIRFTARVRELTTVTPNDNQLGALVSLAYNIGLAALARSTVLRLHNAGDTQGAARAFLLWDKARVNGKLTTLRGLTSRRVAESALYLTPVLPEEEEPMPQAVAEESPLTQSPIARGGAITAASGGAIGLLPLLDQVQATTATAEQSVGVLGRMREQLGITPEVLLGLLVASAGLYVWHWRRRQREQGWC